jgi:hypothetical protein
MTPQNRLGGGNRILRQVQTRGKIIPATCWQNTQNNVSAERCIRQSLKRAVATEGKQEPYATVYGGECVQFEVFSTPN